MDVVVGYFTVVHGFAEIGVGGVRSTVADGLIYQQIKFCDYWGYERASAFHVMKEKYGYPVLSIDRPYAVGTSGQLRTRIQAFVESLEIKRINAGRKL